MKELRSVGGHLRALFCFDPVRNAIVLIGGDKTDDWTGWYERTIPRADDLYDDYLAALRSEECCPMTKTRNWRELRGPRTPAEEAQVEHYKRLMTLEGKLARMRETAGVSQRTLAERMDVSQPNISRIEREDDLHLSTLSKYVAALGGHLEVRAVFDDVDMIVMGNVEDHDSTTA